MPKSIILCRNQGEEDAHDLSSDPLGQYRQFFVYYEVRITNHLAEKLNDLRSFELYLNITEMPSQLKSKLLSSFDALKKISLSSTYPIMPTEISTTA